MFFSYKLMKTKYFYGNDIIGIIVYRVSNIGGLMSNKITIPNFQEMVDKLFINKNGEMSITLDNTTALELADLLRDLVGEEKE